jgi:hypothetical protein
LVSVTYNSSTVKKEARKEGRKEGRKEDSADNY